MPAIKCVGILTSGGDAPGMNAAIRAVTRAAIYQGIKVKGIYRGYKGMITDEIEEFKTQNVSNIIQRGGTILKTARCAEFKTPEGRKQAHDKLMEHGIDSLVVIGGDGSLTGARIFAEEYNMQLRGQSNATRFEFLIEDIAKENPVVILLDEYDKPILNTLTTPEATACRDVLKGFYSSIKKCESKERFVFVTGVTKFCHVSLFSDLNNLTDISMDYDYATMFGYTQEEFETYFADRIDFACKQLNMPREELLPEIKAWYDGYKFHADAESVYNPVSLAQFFTKRYEFNNYWFSTGTPSFLVELTKKADFNFEKTLSEPVMGLAFNAFEIDKIDPLALLLQTGYLTIKSSFVDLGETLYYLDFPNREVKNAFETYLISDYASIPQETVGANVFKMVKAIKARDINLFMELLKTFFAAVQYDVATDTEGRFQLLFYSVFLLIGVRVEAESRTNNGRIDAVICDGDHVYIFEFKINQTAGIALDQIREKEYFRKYQHSGRKIILVGANFDTVSRQITDWKSETAG